MIEITQIDGELFFQTKGDANEYPDSELVSAQNLVGKTVLYIPYVGNIAYLSQLHTTPLAFMGKRISVAFLLILPIGLTIIGMEVKNMWEWVSTPEFKRRQERLKKRRRRLLKRKKVFGVA